MSPWSCRQKVRNWSVGLALLVIAGGAALALARGLRSSPQDPRAVAESPLVVKDAWLHFGEVVEASDFRYQLPLRNASSEPLSVRLEKACDCAGIEPERLELAPGEMRRVTVRLDLLHNRMSYAGRPIRPFRANLTAHYGDGPGEYTPLVLTGSVRAILDMWPPNVNLKAELIEGEESAEEVATIKSVVPLQWLVVKHAPPNYLDSHIEPTEKGYTLRVRVKAGMPRGWFSKDVVLQPADEKGKPLPEQVLRVTGTVTGRFVCVPAESTFGIQTLGSAVEEVVQIRSRKGEPFSVVQAAAQDASTRVEANARDAEQKSFRIVQRIAKAGVREERVAFVVRDVHGKDHPVEYKMLYYGTETR